MSSGQVSGQSPASTGFNPFPWANVGRVRSLADMEDTVIPSLDASSTASIAVAPPLPQFRVDFRVLQPKIEQTLQQAAVQACLMTTREAFELGIGRVQHLGAGLGILVAQQLERARNWRPQLAASADQAVNDNSTLQLSLSQQLYSKGRSLERDCDPVAAATTFEELCKVEPTSTNLSALSKNLSDVVYLSGISKASLMDFSSKAVEAASGAVEADPAKAEGHLARCISRGRLAIISDSRNKVLLAKAASDDAKMALEVDPTNDLAHHLMGRWHFEMAGINPFVRSLIGMIFGASLMPGTYPEALSFYRSAAAISPSRLIHRVGLGQALIKVGDVGSAVRELQASLEMDVEDINARFQLDEAKEMLATLKKSKNYAQFWGPDAAAAAAGGGAAAANVPTTTSHPEGVKPQVEPQVLAPIMAVEASSRVVAAQAEQPKGAVPAPAPVTAMEVVSRPVEAAAAAITGSVSAASKTEPTMTTTVDVVVEEVVGPNGAFSCEESALVICVQNSGETFDVGVGSGLATMLRSVGPRLSSLMHEHLDRAPAWRLELPQFPGFLAAPQAPGLSAVVEEDASVCAERALVSQVQQMTQDALQHERTCNPAAAAALFEEVTKLQPNPDALSLLSKNLSDMTYLPTMSRDRVVEVNTQAIEAARAAVEADPENVKGHLALCVSRGRLALFSDTRTKVQLAKAASDDAKTALEVDPSNDLALHLMGRWHYEMAGINPFVRAMVNVLFGTSLMQGTYPEALSFFRSAADQCPMRLIHRVELGRTLWKVGEVNKAIEELEASLALDIEDINAQQTRESAEKLLQTLRKSKGAATLWAPPAPAAAQPMELKEDAPASPPPGGPKDATA